MSWATKYIQLLQAGQTVSFRPHGNSMTPRINSGALCTVAPVKTKDIERGDVVLCKVKGSVYLHLVSSITCTTTPRFQISNNHGHVNGWIGPSNIFGKLIRVDK